MIKTTTVFHIVERVISRVRWIVITGAPGEGKTTLGYLVLKEMLRKNYTAVHLTSPDEYSLVCDHSDEKVIFMLNDVLGAFAYNEIEARKWKSFITKVHESINDKDESKRSSPFGRGVFLFIGRKDVFVEAACHFGKNEHSIFHKCEFNLSENHLLTLEEKHLMLDCHLKNADIVISDFDKHEVCSGMCPHGFPHCCRMFVELTKIGKFIDIIQFFAAPLQFLHQTTKLLIKDKKKKTFFKTLLRGNGKMNISDIEDEDLLEDICGTCKILSGSYVENHGTTIKFIHPSIYESVAYAIGCDDPVFVVQYCNVSFIMQRVKVGQNRQENPKDYVIYINLSTLISGYLSLTFAKAIKSGTYGVLTHEACMDETLCRKMFAQVVKGNTQNSALDKPDKEGFTLLFIGTRCGNLVVVRTLLEMGADPNKHIEPNCEDDELDFKSRTPLQLACENIILDNQIVTELTKLGANVNDIDIDGITPLHQVCMDKEIPISTPPFTKAVPPEGRLAVFTTLLASGGDINKPSGKDHFYRTPLHMLCRNDEVDVKVFEMLPSDTDYNRLDRGSRSPLTTLCQQRPHGMEAVIILMLQRGDDRYRLDFHGNLCRIPSSIPIHLNNEISPLTHAILTLDKREVKILMQKGEDADATDKFGRTPLHHLCLSQIVDTELLTLLSSTRNVNKRDKYGSLPLHYLCRRRKLSNPLNLISVLLQQTSDVNVCDEYNLTPLEYLLSRNRIKSETDLVATLKMFLQNGVDLNAGYKFTPLHYLIDALDINILQLLLNHNVDLNKDTGDGLTLIHNLCVTGSINYLEMIIGKVDVNQPVLRDVRDPMTSILFRKDSTPLHLACQTKMANVELVAILLDNGADIDKMDCRGFTAIHYIFFKMTSFHVDRGRGWRKHPIPESTTPTRDSIAVLLFERGADRYKQSKNVYKQDISQNYDTHHEIALFDAVINGSSENMGNRISELQNEGCDITQTDKYGRTALHYLCLREEADLEVLASLSKKDTINRTDIYGNTPLFHLCRKRELQYDHIELLLLKGADVNLGDEFSITCLCYLVPISYRKLYFEEDTNQIHKILHLVYNRIDVHRPVTHSNHVLYVEEMTFCVGASPLHVACREEGPDQQFIELLLERGADIDAVDNAGRTPLHYICKYCAGKSQYTGAEQHCLCRVLIENGADLYRQDKEGVSSLHGECKQAYLQRVQWDSNAPPATDKFRRTPVHYLCLSDEISPADLEEISHVNDVTKTDRYGNTALQYLCRREDTNTVRNRSKLVEILLQHGSDINKQDEFGVCSLSYLRDTWDTSLLDVLLSTCPEILNEDCCDGLTLLHYLCVTGNNKCLKNLVTHVDVNKPISKDIRDMEGNVVFVKGSTALHLACQSDKSDGYTVELLVMKGADDFAVDGRGLVPFRYAHEMSLTFVWDRIGGFWNAYKSHKYRCDKKYTTCCRLLDNATH